MKWTSILRAHPVKIGWIFLKAPLTKYTQSLPNCYRNRVWKSHQSLLRGQVGSCSCGERHPAPRGSWEPLPLGTAQARPWWKRAMWPAQLLVPGLGGPFPLSRWVSMATTQPPRHIQLVFPLQPALVFGYLCIFLMKKKTKKKIYFLTIRGNFFIRYVLSVYIHNSIVWCNNLALM